MNFLGLSVQKLEALWVALRRSRRDAHARKNALRLLFFLVIGLTYVGWYLFQFRWAVTSNHHGLNIFLMVALSGMLLWGVGSSAYYKWEQRKQERDNPSIPMDLKLTLYREACLLATLLERLGSEIGMQKKLPPGVEVITRRVLLDRLKAMDLRNNLEPWLLDIMLAPDGHWPSSIKNNAQNAWESLAVLQWVLGMGELRGLTQGPKYSMSEARALLAVKEPAKLNVLPPWDIRALRNETDIFFTRCWSELIARREVGITSEEEVVHALEIRAKIQAEGYTHDYLIGAHTIPEVPSLTLWSALTRAYNRWQALSLLVDITSGEKPAAELRSYFAHFFSTDSAEVQAAAEQQA